MEDEDWFVALSAREKQWYTGVLEKIDAWVDPLPTMKAILDLDKLGCSPDEIAWLARTLLFLEDHDTFSPQYVQHEQALIRQYLFLLYQYSDPEEAVAAHGAAPDHRTSCADRPGARRSGRAAAPADRQLGLLRRREEDAAVQVQRHGAAAAGGRRCTQTVRSSSKWPCASP